MIARVAVMGQREELRAAATAGDDARMEALLEGEGPARVQAWEHLAHQLLAAGEHDAALTFYGALARRDVSLSAWNNYCHAATKAQRAADRELLVGAGARAPQNPSIPHNLACAWVTAGDLERALEAVALAVRVNYFDLDGMRTDQDLAPLFPDPRFAAAFEAPAQVDPGALILRDLGDLDLVAARVVLAVEVFLRAGPLPRLAHQTAAALEPWFAKAPPHPYEHQIQQSPEGRHDDRWVPFGKKGQARLLARLRTKVSEQRAVGARLGHSLNGEPGERDVTVELWPGDHSRSSRLLACLPVDHAHDPDGLAERLKGFAAGLPIQRARGGFHCGVRFGSTSAAELAKQHLHRHHQGLRTPWLSHDGKAWHRHRAAPQL